MALSWIVGRGGLLGRHVEASVARDPGAEIWLPESPISWADPETAVFDLEREMSRFLERATRSSARWRLIWCAGTGVVATSPDALARETGLLRQFLTRLSDRLQADPPLARAGTVFFASSAGGVYAGCSAIPPFDERTPVRAIGPYGREKLAQEELFTNLSTTCGVDLLIGRLSNLYGPGQELTKPQGLISHVGRAALRREPVSIFVPLDTIRDYLYAADAGRMIVETIRRRDVARRRGTATETVTKIFASEVETTVASILGAWRQVLRRPLRVAFSSSPTGHQQPRCLAFRSLVYPDVRGQPTLLPLGIDAIRREQLSQLQSTGTG